MAITKTTQLQFAAVYPKTDSSAASTTNAGNPGIHVVERITLDDSSDDQLPITTQAERNIWRYVSDGGSATDVSSEDALIQSIAGAIWS
jgi:hypothetical protein